MSLQIQLNENQANQERRCSYCHDSVDEVNGFYCPGCQTLLHGECIEELKECPTLACGTQFSPELAEEKEPDIREQERNQFYNLSRRALYGGGAMFLLSLWPLYHIGLLLKSQNNSIWLLPLTSLFALSLTLILSASAPGRGLLRELGWGKRTSRSYAFEPGIQAVIWFLLLILTLGLASYMTWA